MKKMASFNLNVLCFDCRGIQPETYLKSGYFKKITNFELVKVSSSTVEFFGKLFPNSSCMWINLVELFLEIKRAFFIIKGIAVANINSLKSDPKYVDVESLRMKILKVLQFFLANLQEFASKKSTFQMSTHCGEIENKHLKNMLTQLTREIKNLLLFIGRISNIPGLVNIRDFCNETSRSSTTFYHYYHLCLDIWYMSFALFYNISFLLPDFDINELVCDNFIDMSSPFLQVTSFLMYEFVSLAINRYSNANFYSNSPFSCPCIKEFWIMLIHSIENSKLFIKDVSFWNFYESILQILMKNVSGSLPSIAELSIDSFSICDIPLAKEKPIEATLWVTSQIAPLFKYDTEGNFCEHIKPVSGYASGKYLVHNLLLSNSEISEKNLRTSLSYCILLVKLWEPSGEILLPLADFFIKKVEETFSIQNNELTGLTFLFKDSSSWFSYICNFSNPNVTGRDNSYDRFLRILHIQLECDGDSSVWRSLKGRVYSKFVPRKFKEMSAVGLQNSFSLLLAIAAAGQFEITTKICEISSVIELTPYPKKQEISWKAVFVLLCICQERKQTMHNILTLITKFFNTACSDYAKVNKDSIRKLLFIYIDSTNEMFKRNDQQDLSICQLITSGFSVLLPSCSATEVNYILSMFCSILQRLIKDAESYTIDNVSNEALSIRIVEAIFTNIYPFIESVAATDDPPLVVSDVAVALTKIIYRISSCLNCLQHSFNDIFIHFGCKETVNCAISCRYLSNILDCSHIMDELELKIADLDTILFQSWLKCTVYIHTKCDFMEELTKKVLKNEMVNIGVDLTSLCNDANDHVRTSINMYRLIGNSFNKSTPQQKTQAAGKLQPVFKNFANYALNKIKKGKDDKNSLVHVYKLISHLVENCSTLLHHHITSDQILLQLLDKTVYPQLLFPRDKAVQSLVSCSIKEYLPNILRGLFKLEYRKDKSIEREIRNITMYYLNIFPPSSNPITKLMIDSVMSKLEGLSMDAYIFMLEVLKSSLLSNNVEKPLCILEFYQEVFRLIPPSSKKEITNILLMCAMEIFMKQNNSHSEAVRILIKKTLIYFRDKMRLSETMKILTPIIQWFIKQKLPWSVVRGFSVLDILVEYVPQVMSNNLPFLTQSVEMLEMNRGLGEDMLLRGGLRNIVAKLQQKLKQ